LEAEATALIVGIFGTGRNGSSLISRLLDGLGDSYVHPVEECFASAFNALARRPQVGRLVLQNCTNEPLTRMGGAVYSERIRSFLANNVDTLNNEYIERCRATRQLERLDLKKLLPKSSYRFDEMIDGYLGGIAKHVRSDQAISNCVFKSIETPYIADYAQAIPQMRFIHIFRDPVAVCSSQKRSLLENKKVPASYLGYDWLTCMLTKRWVPHAQYVLDRKADAAHIVVRYEDLVTGPDREIGRIASWLNLAPPPRPGIQTVFGDLDMDSWGFNPSKKGVETPTEVVSNLQEINKYDEILTSREIDLINAKTAPYLGPLGYRTPSIPKRSMLIIHNLLPDKWEYMHCRSALSWLRALRGMLYRRLHIVFS